MTTIERLDRPSRAEFHKRFVEPNLPVVICSAIEDWPARAWTPAFFRERYADLPVVVEVWETDERTTNADDYGAHMRHERMPLGRYIDLVLERGPSKQYYLVQCPIFEKLPELRGATRPLGYYSEFVKKLVIPELLWLGPEGTVTPTHFDFAHNFLVQVCGRKVVTLFSPDQSPLLYYPNTLKKWNFSPVDIEAPDLATYPRFAEARPLQVTLEPGELLFIPRPWWHHVRSLDVAISLNFWWMSWGEALAAAPAHLVRLLRHRVGLGKSPYDPS